MRARVVGRDRPTTKWWRDGVDTGRLPEGILTVDGWLQQTGLLLGYHQRLVRAEADPGGGWSGKRGVYSQRQAALGKEPCGTRRCGLG